MVIAQIMLHFQTLGGQLFGGRLNASLFKIDAVCDLLFGEHDANT